MELIEKMSGHKFLRATTAQEKNNERVDETHAKRLRELKIKAVIRLRGQGIQANEADITQIGQEGFYYKVPGKHIPEFENFGLKTRHENRRIFNAQASAAL